MTHLILVRHAESEGNRQGVMHGVTEWPLSVVGERQAELLAGALADERPVAICSSPLQRAQQTAGAIAGRHALDVLTYPGLVEYDFGECEGLTGRQIMRRDPALWSRWRSGQFDDFAFPGGEAVTGFHERVRQAISAVTAVHPAGTVIAVAHCWVIASALAQLLRGEPAGWLRYASANTGVSRVQLSVDGSGVLLTFNDCNHLAVPA